MDFRLRNLTAPPEIEAADDALPKALYLCLKDSRSISGYQVISRPMEMPSAGCNTTSNDKFGIAQRAYLFRSLWLIHLDHLYLALAT